MEAFPKKAGPANIVVKFFHARRTILASYHRWLSYVARVLVWMEFYATYCDINTQFDLYEYS